MTDAVRGGFTYSRGRTTKVIFECRDIDEAQTVVKNALNHSDMSEVHVCNKLPVFDDAHFISVFQTKKDLPYWYQAGFFTNKEVMPDETVSL